MGKSKAKKYKVKSSNPTGLHSIKDLEMAECEMPVNVNAGNVEEIVEKLQSRKVEERECAAVIIANLSSNTEFIASIIENKVIRVAAPLLIDRNLGVRHAIAGCLRNIAVCGDYLVSEALVEQDIMTSLAILLEEYRDPWTVHTSEDKIDSKTAIFKEACGLLWSLCENSALAVSIFNQKNLISILLPCLNTDVYGLQVPVVVAQCLHTVGENNERLNEILRQPFAEELLKGLLTLPTTKPEHVLLRILAAGLKLNMFTGKLDDCMDDVSTSILDMVSATLDEQTMRLAEFLALQIIAIEAKEFHNEDIKDDKKDANEDIKDGNEVNIDDNEDNIEDDIEDNEDNIDDKKDKKDKKVKEDDYADLKDKFVVVNMTRERLLLLLSAKQCALEILGKMFEDDEGDDNDEWDDMSSCDSAEVMDDTAEMEVDKSGVSVTELGTKLPEELQRRLVNGQLLQKVLEQIVMPQGETFQVLSTQTKDCFKKIQTIQCTALLCLNNIIQKIDIKNLGGPSKLLELSNNLSDLLFKKTDLSDTDQVEAVARCMSAVMRKLAEADCSSYFSHMTESDLELLTNICQQSQDSRIKVHVIRILGTLGCLLGNLKTPTAGNLIKIIGTVLLEICSKSCDMWVTAEALDVIFDVFGEDHVDGIAKQILLVEKLQHILPSLKGKIKHQRKSFGEHLPVIMTAKDNLIRFIKYKNEFHKT